MPVDISILCSACNKTLGHVKDDTSILRKMIAYLEAHAEKARAA
jgi:hypothetical protein